MHKALPKGGGGGGALLLGLMGLSRASPTVLSSSWARLIRVFSGGLFAVELSQLLSGVDILGEGCEEGAAVWEDFFNDGNLLRECGQGGGMSSKAFDVTKHKNMEQIKLFLQLNGM